MKKGLDNKKLQESNITTEGQMILIQRLMELVDNKTIDTYKNRLNNIHGSLIELIGICEKVQKGIIKDSHIDSVKTECQIKLGQEIILKKYNKHVYDILNSRIKSKKGTLLNFISELQVIQKELENNYLDWILKELKLNIDNDDIENINKGSQNLIEELVLRGWTKYSIHKIIEKMFINNSFEFDKKWDELIKELGEEKKEFKFFIKLDSDLNSYLGKDLIDKTYIIDKFPDIQFEMLEDEGKYIYLKSNSFKNDLNKAAEDILNEINSIEAEHIYCGSCIRLRKNAVIILLPNERTIKYNINKYNIRISYEDQNIIKFNYSQFDKVRENKDVIIDTRNRLNNVLMQYRLGYNTDSVETWFTSFWFALESLVVTDQYDNIINHIVEIVTPIVTLKYPEKILVNLIEDFERCGIDLDCFGINKSNEISSNICVLLDILKSEEQFNSLSKAITNYSLLNLRLKQIQDIFKNSKTLKSYLENHHRNIEYHLRRLYRVRNSFVHNAKIEYDLYPITMHLHSYLRDIIEEIVKGINCGCFNDINRIYSCCKIRYESIIGNLQVNGNSNYENELIISQYCNKK